MKLLKYLGFGIVVLLFVGGLAIVMRKDVAQAPQVIENQQPDKTETITPPAVFDLTQFSLTETASPWVIVNKTRPISLEYVPSDLVAPKVTLNNQKTAEENQLRQLATPSLETLFADAEKAGYKLMLASGYRSSKLQATYYNGYVARDGQEAADRYSARPGTSEHQTGLSLDIARTDRNCYLEICFGDTPEGKWLAAHAHQYGFIVRYPNGKESITGYQYEPWHFRFVGKELASELQNASLTMEEFFKL